MFRLILAFPPSRATRSHLHTGVPTEWVHSLPSYDIPEHIQGDVDWTGHFRAFQPWRLRDSYRERLHNLLFIEVYRASVMAKSTTVLTYLGSRADKANATI